MVAPDSALFPLVEMHAVANAQNEWVGLSVRSGEGIAPSAALHALFGKPDLLTAIAPMDCVLMLDSPLTLSAALLALMPASRMRLVVGARSLQDDAERRQMSVLHDAGYRILIDGEVPEGVAPVPGLRSFALNCRDLAPAPGSLLALYGPHLAYHVDSGERMTECAEAGFALFSGAYPLHPKASEKPNDGTSRKRLLNLLGLLARDADTRELETLLKQDPALSYHLLRLVNSAAFALSTEITSFGQAISLLGRRQLQRWLQLLLYARRQDDGLPNPLLPVAALRAAQLESLCKLEGGDRDAQDLAFMTGVFSLLDVLFRKPMNDLIGAVGLPPAAADALLARQGRLGTLLSLVEAPRPGRAQLHAAGIDPQVWWQSQLNAYHWAIQVSRNL